MRGGGVDDSARSAGGSSMQLSDREGNCGGVVWEGRPAETAHCAAYSRGIDGDISCSRVGFGVIVVLA